jgi:hypothetical protein
VEEEEEQEQEQEQEQEEQESQGNMSRSAAENRLKKRTRAKVLNVVLLFHPRVMKVNMSI